MAAENSQNSNVPKYLRKVELTQENSNSLPPYLAIHFGNHLPSINIMVWHTTKQLQGILNSQKHFIARDSDIIIVTLPKSGTTWLKALAYAILNRKIHYPNPNLHKNQCHPHPLVTANPHDKSKGYVHITVALHQKVTTTSPRAQ
ncbi:cytosolic sulfotransferase 12-like, partial [Prosopis cineraria]|uniref:cytosolic sulfotransferase 12-like n=1 Tax=Prosopis cineraria TaxID=364024 RepID=UPI00240F84E8